MFTALVYRKVSIRLSLAVHQRRFVCKHGAYDSFIKEFMKLTSCICIQKHCMKEKGICTYCGCNLWFFYPPLEPKDLAKSTTLSIISLSYVAILSPSLLKIKTFRVDLGLLNHSQHLNFFFFFLTSFIHLIFHSLYVSIWFLPAMSRRKKSLYRRLQLDHKSSSWLFGQFTPWASEDIHLSLNFGDND